MAWRLGLKPKPKEENRFRPKSLNPPKSSSLGPKPEILQDFTNSVHKAMCSTKCQNTDQRKQEQSSMQVWVKNPNPQGIKFGSKAQTTPRA